MLLIKQPTMILDIQWKDIKDNLVNGHLYLLAKCTAETVYRLTKALGVSMENLLEPYMQKKERVDFEIYKSNVCHRVKELGDVDFIIETLEQDKVHAYYQRKWYPECFYLLAMVDYLSRTTDVPLCKEYDELRGYKLEETVYPAGVLSICAVSGNDDAKKRAKDASIPEFMRFNIVESEIRDVV